MPKTFTPKQIIVVGGAILAVILIFGVVLLNLRTKNTAQNGFTLTIWGTDPQRVFSDIIAQYAGPGSGTDSHISYVHINPEEYRTRLLAALAAGTGPDIFEIDNRDLSQWSSVLAPLPVTPNSTFNLVTLQNDFPSVVTQDFTLGGQIYALPFSIDTLALIYNKDMFDSAGIAFPPKTWDEFQGDIAGLRIVSPQGEITRAAAAIGGSSASIANAADLIFLLMLQNGTQMTSKDGSTVSFASDSSGSRAGINAFNFYLQFANAQSPYYTWNDALGNSLDSFVQGKTAALFDYGAALSEIKAKAPFLNVGVASMPQPKGATVSINYPKYRGLAVSRNGQVASAWSFITSLTTSPADEKIYTDDMGTSPALRSMIQAAITSPVGSVFASQALTARSWHETDSAKIDDIMSAAVESVLTGATDSAKALTQAQTGVNEIRN